jgi:hypothetical protein
MEAKYGKIVKSKILQYYKFRFHMKVKTDKGYTIKFIVDGDSISIHKYNPFGDWEEHYYANGNKNLLIKKIKKNGKKKKLKTKTKQPVFRVGRIF